MTVAKDLLSGGFWTTTAESLSSTLWLYVKYHLVRLSHQFNTFVNNEASIKTSFSTLCIHIWLSKKGHSLCFLQTNRFADNDSFGDVSAGGSDTVFTLMPPDLIISRCAAMRGKIKMCLGVSFFHITKNVVLDPWVINCAGVSTGCHHFPWLNPAACSALQLAHHSQLHKSVLCYTPTAPTCRSVSNVIVIVPSSAVWNL